MAIPILSQYPGVDFKWNSEEIKIERSGAKGSKITASAVIGGKIYTIVHKDTEKVFTKDEAKKQLTALTDKIILMQARYFYEDVASIVFDDKEQIVKRTYEKPEKHKKSSVRKFDYDFDAQLMKAHEKLSRIPDRQSEKYKQTENRIQRIERAKELYNYLKGQRIALPHASGSLAIVPEARVSHASPRRVPSLSVTTEPGKTLREPDRHTPHLQADSIKTLDAKEVKRLSEIEWLNRRIGEYEMELARADKKYQDLRQELEFFKKDEEEWRKGSLKNFEKALNEFNLKLQKKEEELAKIKQEFATSHKKSQEEVDDLQERLKKEMSHVKNLLRELEVKNSELTAIKDSQLLPLQSIVRPPSTTPRSQPSSLRGSFAFQEGESISDPALEDLQKRIQELTESKFQLEAAFNAHLASIEGKHKKQLEEALRLQNGFEKDLQHMRGKLAEADKKNGIIRSANKALYAENKELLVRIDQLEERKENTSVLKAELQRTASKNKNLLEEMATLKDQLSNFELLEGQYEASKLRNKELTLQIRTLTLHLSELKEKIQLDGEMIAELEKERTRVLPLKQRLEVLETEKNRLEKDLEAMQSLSREREKLLSTLEKENEELYKAELILRRISDYLEANPQVLAEMEKFSRSQEQA